MTALYDSLLAGTTSPGLFTWRGDTDRDLIGEAVAAGWQAYDLDSRRITTVEEFYDTAAAVLGRAGRSVRGADALFDSLVKLGAGPTVLVWDGLRALAGVDPVETTVVLDALRRAAEHVPALAVVLLDDLDVSGFDGLR